MNEVWKEIGENSNYFISNLGKIKRNNKILKLNKNARGYLYCNISTNGKVTKVKIHRLVAITFVDNLNNKDTVNHIDGNKLNNCSGNLEWCTAKENINHGTCIQRRVEKQKITNRRRKPVISIDESGNEKEYLSAWDASRKIGAFQSNIWKAIHNGKKCNGYYWKYKEE